MVLNLKAPNSCDKTGNVRYYDYCSSNLDNFLTDVKNNMSDPTIFNNFGDFNTALREAIDRNCKLEKPKTSKRTPICNPWITPGLISACERKHQLRKDYLKSRTKRNSKGDPVLEKKFKDYQRTLKNTIHLAKSQYYSRDISSKTGDRKKMWQGASYQQPQR